MSCASQSLYRISEQEGFGRKSPGTAGLANDYHFESDGVPSKIPDYQGEVRRRNPLSKKILLLSPLDGGKWDATIQSSNRLGANPFQFTLSGDGRLASGK